MTQPGAAFVTEAAGFIGSHLSARLLDSGWDVVAVDCFTGPNDRSVQRARATDLVLRGAPFLRVDLRETTTEQLAGLVPEEATVFHLAALPGVRPSLGPRRHEYVVANVDVTKRVVAAASVSGSRRLVYASSSSVYGQSGGKAPESTRTCPISPYGRTKLAGELAVRKASSGGLVDAVVVRYFTVYGPGQRPDMALARFIHAAELGRPIHVFGTGRQRRDFTFVDDIVRGTLAAAERGAPERVYNLGSGRPVELAHAIASIRRVTGSRSSVVHYASAEGDPDTTHADTTSARRELGWSAKVGLETGLRRQIAAHSPLNTHRRDTA